MQAYTHPSPAAPNIAAASAIVTLNAVAVSAEQIEVALEILALLPAHLRDQPFAQAAALQAYARDAGFEDDAVAAAALHARVTALAKWTADHDPERQSYVRAVLEATARYPLSDDKGIAFEPGGFQELILFVEELPF